MLVSQRPSPRKPRASSCQAVSSAPAGRKGSGLGFLRMSSPVRAEPCLFLHESQASSENTTQMSSPRGLLLPRFALHEGLSRSSGSTMKKHQEPERGPCGSHGEFVGDMGRLAPRTTLQTFRVLVLKDPVWINCQPISSFLGLGHITNHGTTFTNVHPRLAALGPAFLSHVESSHRPSGLPQSSGM